MCVRIVYTYVCMCGIYIPKVPLLLPPRFFFLTFVSVGEKEEGEEIEEEEGDETEEEEEGREDEGEEQSLTILLLEERPPNSTSADMFASSFFIGAHSSLSYVCIML